MVFAGGDSGGRFACALLLCTRRRWQCGRLPRSGAAHGNGPAFLRSATAGPGRQAPMPDQRHGNGGALHSGNSPGAARGTVSHRRLLFRRTRRLRDGTAASRSGTGSQPARSVRHLSGQDGITRVPDAQPLQASAERGGDLSCEEGRLRADDAAQAARTPNVAPPVAQCAAGMCQSGRRIQCSTLRRPGHFVPREREIGRQP